MRTKGKSEVATILFDSVLQSITVLVVESNKVPYTVEVPISIPKYLPRSSLQHFLSRRSHRLIFNYTLSEHRTVNNARTDVNTYLSENLSGMKVTQIFNQEQRKMDEFLVRSKRLEKTKMNRMFVFGIFRPMVYMLFVTSNLFLFYIGCKGYIKDTTFLGQTITSETVVAFYMYISRFFNPIQALAEQFDMLEQSFAAAEKIFTILDMVPEVVDEPDAIELKEMKGEIEFRDVWFAYNPGEWVR